jgi:surfeit locus 1 family protein
MMSRSPPFLQRFHFTLWPTVFTIPALILLIGLGTWQVERLAWKTDLIARREAQLAAPPTVMPETLDAATPLDFHHVTTTGTFQNDKELYIAALDKRGISGFQVVTPLELEDGKILLVNRGFVPDRNKRPETREAGQLTGTVAVEGILRLAVVPTGWIVPQNQPGDNFWIYVDVPAMAAAIHLDPAQVLPFYIEAGPTPNPGGFPIGGQTRISLPNDHLQYAITWYSFAVSLLVIYFLYHYRKPTDDSV